MPADRAVAAAPAVEHRLGHRAEARHESGVVAVPAGPEVGVGADHALEGRDGATAGFVHEVELDPEFLALALHHDAVAEFGVVGDVDLAVGREGCSRRRSI